MCQFALSVQTAEIRIQRDRFASICSAQKIIKYRRIVRWIGPLSRHGKNTKTRTRVPTEEGWVQKKDHQPVAKLDIKTIEYVN